MSDLTQAFGERLLVARFNYHHVSQETIAERVGVHRTQITLLEGGRRDPRLSTFVKLAGAWAGITGGELLDRLLGTTRRRGAGALHRHRGRLGPSRRYPLTDGEAVEEARRSEPPCGGDRRGMLWMNCPMNPRRRKLGPEGPGARKAAGRGRERMSAEERSAAARHAAKSRWER